ncbi:GlyGly-CTERM sorting domain-containing protein, partial [Lachnospiraceae bacterium OF11-28]
CSFSFLLLIFLLYCMFVRQISL